MRLPKSLQASVIGATYHKSMDPDNFQLKGRGMQVAQDTRNRNPAKWLSLDDDYVDWPQWDLQNYVRTDPILGISKPEVLR